ncbi:unnamed protein product, partial [marine sediment metagenome]
TPSEPLRDESGDEVADVEEPEKQEKSKEPLSVKEPISLRERIPKQKRKKPRHVVRVKGKNVEFRHEFAPLGEKEAWSRWTFEKSTGLVVYTNTDFPAYFTTKDKPFYAAIHIAEAISALLVQETGSGPEEADDIKQLILRKAAAVKDEWIEEVEDEAEGEVHP